MDVDILAVQEIKTTTEAQNAWNKVTRQLKNYTGDNWEVILNSCGNSNNQHLGFLYNANKVKYTERKEVWQFNGKANSASNPCINNLRPGYLAYFQSKVDNGFDFYAIAVHLDSGQTDRDLSNRQTAIARIDEVTKPLEAIDGDIVILGDFNTMGINQGISAKEEIKELKEKVVTESPGFELLTVQPSCTHYYQKKPGWLDQILVSQDTKELINNNAYVQGYCALNSCNSLNGSLPDAALSLSDHCPVIVDFNNSDLD
jgi:predicted extracellular nuclease